VNNNSCQCFSNTYFGWNYARTFIYCDMSVIEIDRQGTMSKWKAMTWACACIQYVQRDRVWMCVCVCVCVRARVGKRRRGATDRDAVSEERLQPADSTCTQPHWDCYRQVRTRNDPTHQRRTYCIALQRASTHSLPALTSYYLSTASQSNSLEALLLQTWLIAAFTVSDSALQCWTIYATYSIVYTVLLPSLKTCIVCRATLK